jgi:hypothetical protein
MTEVDFTKLSELHKLARQASVSWKLFYDESDGFWLINICSAAESEREEFKGIEFDFLVERVVEFLTALVAPGGPGGQQQQLQGAPG